MTVLSQENFEIKAAGSVTYPPGTRIVTLIVPPGVVFEVPDGVLVESDVTT